MSDWSQSLIPAARQDELQNLSDQQQMTHQAARPNPAQPYLDWLRSFANRNFVEPLQATGFIPGGQDWGRPAAEGMMDFQRGGLTGADPQLRNVMPEAANTLGGLVQSRAAQDAFSAANVGGLPLVEAFWSPRELDILRRLYGTDKFDPSMLPTRTPSVIRQKAFQMGLKRPEKPPYVRQPGAPVIANDPEMVAKIAKMMMNKHMTFDQMASELENISGRSVRRYMNENLKTRRTRPSGPNTPSMPSLEFQKGEAPPPDPEFEKAIAAFMQLMK